MTTDKAGRGMMPLLPPNARTHSGEGETVDDRLQQVQMPPSIPSPSEALLKASRRLDSWKDRRLPPA